MAHEQRAATSTLTLRALLVCLAALLLLPATEVSAQVSAQGRRARLSEDLLERLQAGSTENTCVLVTGTQAQVDTLAARHGLRIHKRLRSGAAVQVSAGSLSALADDEGIESLSGNYRLRAHMGVTTP